MSDRYAPGEGVIGRRLDKYEILEEVGQGGMAVVYKGLDTSLHREVAVKVLHPHLASHEEAKKRFEREARAVAKLRHENILEIFDYSGKDSAESYIVTEFIRGRTLKDFVGEHALAYPEIGAMIAVEVCRALVHAHAGGVLHRDVKPENIMIRDDGVVKLTDFGIAQILDAQRMTVTGQLLGSPAYMAPEHVEGKHLDFRTDVFAVGILLYQLTTGELPFKGRNPHEILKKIADCKYLDARVVNPLVGDRLNKILTKALAKEPVDRYQDVQLVLDDLLRFLGEAELGESRAELAQFFTKPVSYEQALRQRLIGALTKRGKTELAAKRTAVALELFNRVLTMDPANEQVLAEMDRLTRRRRVSRALGIGGAVVLAGAAVTLVVTRWPSTPQRLEAAGPTFALDAGLSTAGVLPATAVADAGSDSAMRPDPRDAAPPVGPRTDVATNDRDRTGPRAEVKPRNKPDAGLAPSAQLRTFRLIPNPKNAQYAIDDGPFQQVGTGGRDILLASGPHRITFRHSTCEDDVHHIAAADPGGTIMANPKYKATRIIPRCAGAKILVDNKIVPSGLAVDITDFERGSKVVLVEFYPDGQDPIPKRVTVRAGAEPMEVSCTDP